MVKNRGVKGKLKSIGFEMIELIADIQKEWENKHGFCPTSIDITNMLARELRKKKIYVS